jgi:penicillin-binding protein 1A
MYEEKMIEEDEFIEFTASPLKIVSKKTSLRQSDFFYTEEVKKELIQNYGDEKLFKEGLVVETNLDLELQEKLFWALRRGIEAYDKRKGWRGPLKKIKLDKTWQKELSLYKKNFQEEEGQLYDKNLALVLSNKNNKIKIGLEDGSEANLIIKNYPQVKKINPGDIIVIKESTKGLFILDQIPAVNGAAVLIENYTGRVLALVGGYNPTASYFNRATQAQRQPGSAFKTFIYLTALERGWTRDSLLIDEPLSISQGKGMPLWQPKNYGESFHGKVTLQEAFSKSLNLATIQVGLALGLDKIYEVAARLGLYPPLLEGKNCLEDPKTKKYCSNYSLLLGAFETSPLKLTGAYASLASAGYEIKPQLINKIYNKEGEELFSSDIKILPKEESFQLGAFRARLVKEETNQEMVKLLMAAFGPTQLTMGGKTGTTNKSYDTWFVGFSKDFTLGVFVGHDKPTSLGRKEVGALVAKPIFIDFFSSMKGKLSDGPIGIGRTAFNIISTNQDQEEEILETKENLTSLDDFLQRQPELLAELEEEYQEEEEKLDEIF